MLERNFNPLPRKEGDSGVLFDEVALMPISIHSLVKRETPNLTIFSCIRNNFNPLPRKEGDFKSPDFFALPVYFNPLPRKEGDLVDFAIPRAGYDFNPLPRKEGD